MFVTRLYQSIVFTLVFTVPQLAISKSTDDLIEQQLFDVCNGAIVVPSTPELVSLCTLAFPPPAGGPPVATLLNTGSASSLSGLSIDLGGQAKGAIEDRLEEIRGEQGGGASANGSNFGFLLAVQESENDREDTELESGYDSNLSGFIVGLDYLFNDALVLGAAVSVTDSDGEFEANSGDFDNESESLVVYGTWIVLDSLTVDFYAGSGDVEYKSTRRVVFGDIDGDARSDYDSDQSFYGASISYDRPIGNWSLGVFAALDSVDTEIDAYAETGTTLLELTYPSQDIDSSTQTIGLRGSYLFNFSWGVLVPSLEYTFVDEKENDKRFIDSRLSILPPDVNFEIETDSPDRDYNYSTLSVVASPNVGGQYFLTVSKLSGHKFLDETSYSIGMLISF